MLAFLSSLTTGPSPLGSNTVKVYRSALALPLRYGFQINTNDRMFTLLAKHQSLANPPVAKIVPQWSLEKVLLFLTSTAFSPPHFSITNQFLKTLFLLALATGNRCSELAALHRPTIAFSRNRSKVTIPVRPGFLYKNQRANRTPPNILIPALTQADGTHHSLCPVRNLERYLKRTKDTSKEAVFVNPKTDFPLNAGRVAFYLCRLINIADPGRFPKAHDVRKVAASVAWCRGLPIPDIVHNGFWANSNVFIARYLHPTGPRPGPCVTLRHSHT